MYSLVIENWGFVFFQPQAWFIYEKKLLLTHAPNRLIWKMSSIDVYSVDIFLLEHLYIY